MDGLMARLQQSQLLRGVVLIVAVLGFLVGVVLVLDFILPNVGRAKDISAIVQSFAASLAIVAAALMPYINCRYSGPSNPT